jgi:hypothetical protein
VEVLLLLWKKSKCSRAKRNDLQNSEESANKTMNARELFTPAHISSDNGARHNCRLFQMFNPPKA